MNVYLTADEHFGHTNILKFRKRFPSLDFMEDTILNEQANVAHDSQNTPAILYHLGDTCWSNPDLYLGRIKIATSHNFEFRHIFLLGSHDRRWAGDAFGMLIYHKGIPVWMTHDPLHANIHFPVNLVGHVHHLWKVRIIEPTLYLSPMGVKAKTVLVNVGVDKWNFAPVRIEDAIGLAKNAAPELFSLANLARYSIHKTSTFIDLDQKGE